jgi:hypothetical protein
MDCDVWVGNLASILVIFEFTGSFFCFSQAMMQIFVRCVEGELRALDVSEMETVASLRERIAMLEGNDSLQSFLTNYFLLIQLKLNAILYGADLVPFLCFFSFLLLLFLLLPLPPCVPPLCLPVFFSGWSLIGAL